MSIFNELLPKINEISNAFTKHFNDDLQAAFESLDNFEADIIAKDKARDPSQKDKNQKMALQSIHEEEDASTKTPENSRQPRKSDGSTESPERGRKKRSKHEVDGMESPEIEKRIRRKASVKAQSVISEQVNLNLTKKIRRETTQKRRHRKEDDKENDLNPILQVKLEKLSLPLESIDDDSMSILPVNVDVKQEAGEEAMPPPPVPKPRKKIDRPEEVIEEDTRRRTTRARKRTDGGPAPAVAARESRSRRARNQARETSATESEKEVAAAANEAVSPAEKPQPKRTKRTQKASEKKIEKPESENKDSSPKECPELYLLSEKLQKVKPKTTKQKEIEKKIEKPESENKDSSTKGCPETYILSPILQQVKPKTTKQIEIKKKIEKPESENKDSSPKECPETYLPSPILQQVKPKTTKQIEIKKKIEKPESENKDSSPKECPELYLLSPILHFDENDSQLIDNNLEKTKLISQLNCTITINKEMNNTIVLPNGGVYSHLMETPRDVRRMNETVVLDKETPNEKNTIMNTTVVLDGAAASPSASLLTDDDEPPARARTPPPQPRTDEHEPPERTRTPPQQPRMDEHTSAVKEKVQQFEEMASRVTRTKTRAMTKKDEPSESQIPPERSQPTIATDTLCKMNNLIFNGKPPQISTSAAKPRSNIPLKSNPSSSESKLSVNGAQEEERREREDARRKKEALLEAKREQQRSKREQKMSAAAAARTAAEHARRAALQAAARERQERQAHADQGRADRLKDAERRRHEQARKAADTEERRRQDDAARARRRADEQRRADEHRRRQHEDACHAKKEAAVMQKEIERRQKEFVERMKTKQRMEGDRMTPLKPACTPAAVEPVYMQDGFQYLNSDEEEPPERPVPAWSSSKARRAQLQLQSLVGAQHVDRLFSVREHTPDLREIFPNIERARLKRTSSAVWRTPPRLPPLTE